MDTRTVARSMRGSIGMLAMDWLMHPSTLDAAHAAGLPEGPAAYAIGRFGVLGDCPVDNVVAAAFFWEPERMRTLTNDGRKRVHPSHGAEVYRNICRQWGARHLDGFADVERLGELCERVVTAASPMGAPTFVGWRDQPLAPVGPSRTFQLCQTMRELRFARHTIAVQAAGLSPLDAILSGPAGEWNAEMFGWPKPYDDIGHLADQRAAIEDHTDELHAPDFDVLTSNERAELRLLAKAARSHASEVTS